MGRTRLIGAAALPLILILAACSSGATPTPPPPSTPPAASQPPASQAAASQAAASPTGSAETGEVYELKVAAGSGSVTNYLTGEDGKTVYVFGKDVADSGKSACGPGVCLDNWPPLAVESLDEVKADSGVTGAVALITRDDGTKQVTYKGLPLYYFAGDKAAGDTNGAAIPNWSVAHP
jgi:predicted lipoprotein with Yx(FWY)xxD motif